MPNSISSWWRRWSWQIARLPLSSFFLWLSFLVSSSCPQLALVDRFWWSLCHTTSLNTRMCLLGVMLIQHPIYGVISHKNHNLFWGQTCKNQNFHIMKITASIPTKFCTRIKTTKYFSLLFHTSVNNPRWWTAAILRNSYIAISPQSLDQFWWNSS